MMRNTVIFLAGSSLTFTLKDISSQSIKLSFNSIFLHITIALCKLYTCILAFQKQQPKASNSSGLIMTKGYIVPIYPVFYWFDCNAHISPPWLNLSNSTLMIQTKQVSILFVWFTCLFTLFLSVLIFLCLLKYDLQIKSLKEH